MAHIPAIIQNTAYEEYKKDEGGVGRENAADATCIKAGGGKLPDLKVLMKALHDQESKKHKKDIDAYEPAGA